MISNIPTFTNKWHGWILTYISSKCLPGKVKSHSREKLNPYRISYMSSIGEIRKKMKYNNFDYVIDLDHIFDT